MVEKIIICLILVFAQAFLALFLVKCVKKTFFYLGQYRKLMAYNGGTGLNMTALPAESPENVGEMPDKMRCFFYHLFYSALWVLLLGMSIAAILLCFEFMCMVSAGWAI